MPGAVNTIRKIRINKRRIKTSIRLSPKCHKMDKSNLVYAEVTNNLDEEAVKISD